MEPSVSEYEAYLREHFEFIKQMSKAMMINAMENLSVEEVLEKFRKGREEYGGAFDPETVACLAELDGEALDSINYTAMFLMQTEH